MNICITNDDGIHGEGLRILAEWAKKLGQVTIVAPKYEQSGKSHSIEFHKPFEVKRVEHPSGVRAFTVDSTPADCVRVAMLAMKEPVDLFFSGVNCGYNLGREIIYSGTVGAALEAAVCGVKAVAFSTGFESFAGAEKGLDAAWDYIRQHCLLETADVLNVNIPEEPTGEIRLTRQGGPFFSDEYTWEGDMLHAGGKLVWTPNDDDTVDTNVVLHLRHTSITPVCNDRTDWHALNRMRGS